MKKITLLIFIIVVCLVSINAQTQIAPEKEKAIKELSALFNNENQAEEIFRLMMGQFNSIQSDVIKTVLDERKDLKPTERKALETRLIEDSVGFNNKIQDKFIQKLDYNKMAEEVMVIVYDKYFTLEEINDLITFYRTPTGQKTLKLMQPMMLEIMQSVQQRLIPKLPVILQELREEQRQEIVRRLEQLKPRTKTRN